MISFKCLLVISSMQNLSFPRMMYDWWLCLCSVFPLAYGANDVCDTGLLISSVCDILRWMVLLYESCSFSNLLIMIWKEDVLWILWMICLVLCRCRTLSFDHPCLSSIQRSFYLNEWLVLDMVLYDYDFLISMTFPAWCMMFSNYACFNFKYLCQ